VGPEYQQTSKTHQLVNPIRPAEMIAREQKLIFVEQTVTFGMTWNWNN